MIYFDNAATSFHKPESVKKIVNFAMSHYTANPGRSGHTLAESVANQIYETREIVKNFFNAQNYDLIFTKNCTESLNLAIFGALNAGDHVITTTFEHNSVLRPLEFLKSKGVEVTVIDCDLRDVHFYLENEIKQNTKMLITTAVSNVTGDKTNIKSCSKICKKYNLLYLVDGAQISGHEKIDLNDLGVDMFAFAGHKGLLAMSGVGGLFKRQDLKLKPLIYGGTGTSSESLIQPTDSEEDYETGTIPTISIISLKEGIKFLTSAIDVIEKKEKLLSEYLFSELSKLDYIELYSKHDSQNVFSFNVKNYDSTEISNYLNEKFGICVRSGLHCAPLTHKHFGTLKRGAVRVSIDFMNTTKEIDTLIYALKKIKDFET